MRLSSTVRLARISYKIQTLGTVKYTSPPKKYVICFPHYLLAVSQVQMPVWGHEFHISNYTAMPQGR